MKKKIATAEPKFEQALKRLEEIVEEMEGGEVSLDDLLAKYEEGTKLAQFCQGKLSEAQQKIEVLAKGKGGEVKLRPFEKSAATEEESDEDSDDENDDEAETKKGSLF